MQGWSVYLLLLTTAAGIGGTVLGTTAHGGLRSPAEPSAAENESSHPASDLLAGQASFYTGTSILGVPEARVPSQWQPVTATGPPHPRYNVYNDGVEVYRLQKDSQGLRQFLPFVWTAVAESGPSEIHMWHRQPMRPGRSSMRTGDSPPHASAGQPTWHPLAPAILHMPKDQATASGEGASPEAQTLQTLVAMLHRSREDLPQRVREVQDHRPESKNLHRLVNNQTVAKKELLQADGTTWCSGRRT